MRRCALVLCSITFAAGCSSSTDDGQVGRSGEEVTGTTAADDDRLDLATPDGDLPDSALPITIVRITDGDSFDVELDGDAETVRLIGMNANEGTECFGPEGRDALIRLLGLGQTGIQVIDGRDDFGRLLVYVWSGNTLVNLAMVEEGFAVARAISDHPFEEEFEAAGRRAQAQQLGFWAPDACGVASDASLEIVDLLANAPGPDNENPNGEWILIENTGDTIADLSNWTIKDESTRHRFDFPDDSSLGPGASAVVYSGCGTDSSNEYYWCSDGSSIWTNSGDTGFLLDPSGNIIDSWSYSG
jgi:micrococcal nuclease